MSPFRALRARYLTLRYPGAVVRVARPPAQLAGRVAAILDRRDKPAPVSFRTPPHGTLRELPVPELLRAIQQDALDGVQLLDHGRKKKAIEFRGGWPIAVRSNLVSECLGSYLVEKGLVSQAQLEESLERVRTGEGLQGEILVAMEVMDEEAVVDALEGHALQKLLEIFSWRDGRFAIRRAVQVQKGSALGIQGHPSKLIVDGVRQHYPLKQIDRYFATCRDAFLVPPAAYHRQEKENGAG